MKTNLHSPAFLNLSQTNRALRILVISCALAAGAVHSTSLDNSSLAADGAGEAGSLEVTLDMHEMPTVERDTYSAGDSYPTLWGERQFRRLSGVVAVRKATGGGKVARLSASASRLELTGFSPAEEFESGIRLYRAEVLTGATAQMSSSHSIGELRQHSADWVIDPVLIDEASGLSQIPTGRIMVRLARGVDPAGYFGADFARAERIAAEESLFALNLGGVTVEETWQDLRRRMADPRVEYAEPDFLSEVIRSGAGGRPNDPLLDRQWSLEQVGLPQAWSITEGREDIVIGVLDDGFDLDHPDLEANVFQNPSEVVDGNDEDGNGYADDVHGWDFCSNDNDPRPTYSEDRHGTATAGIAAAVGENGIGIAGGAYACRFLPIKVIEIEGSKAFSSSSGRVQAIYYAAGRGPSSGQRWRGADILSISMGWSQSQACDDALRWAALNGRNGKGCPVFVAAGNHATRWEAFRIPNLSAGWNTIRWTYKKDGSVSDGDDAAWLDCVKFPDGWVEGFEAGGFPVGWQSGGDKPWSVVNVDGAGNPVASTGGGRRAARSGSIGHSGQSFIEVSRQSPAGEMTFLVRISCEYDDRFLTDRLEVAVNGHACRPFIEDTSEAGLAYPARHPDTISVGSVTETGTRSDYSQYGPGLDLVAPSGGGLKGIVTTDRSGRTGYVAGDYLETFSGTSAACPLAASVGALVLSVNPDLQGSEVRQILATSASKVGGVDYQNGWHPEYGFGQVNAYAALLLSIPPFIELAPGPEGTEITVATMPGQIICVEATSDFVNWTELETRLATSEREHFKDPVGAQSQRFYRVRVAGSVTE
ncbi:MAG: S8 family serine peptidase [Verrucomicrobia bacterium]|nr:S8 family serine peptidase [Verrucomicrobiota bacterium]